MKSDRFCFVAATKERGEKKEEEKKKKRGS
jgi:hypothetical protein